VGIAASRQALKVALRRLILEFFGFPVSIIKPRFYNPGMSNRGSLEGHMGHICVIMRVTHDMRPADRMFYMPDIEYVFFVQKVFYTWK
jgi:hypothetical protein